MVETQAGSGDRYGMQLDGTRGVTHQIERR